jgi:hypothetical protein
MMSDREFSELELRVQICPAQCTLPQPGNTSSLINEDPMTKSWQRLHEAANEARERVSKACMQMDEIDRNANLSREGKYQERSKIAAQAIADFRASKAPARAREAVELAVTKYKFDQHVTPEIAQDSQAALKAMKEVERAWQRAMDKISERVALTKRRSFSPY